MKTHIVRQPILDHNQKLVAYELIYFQNSDHNGEKNESRAANTIISFFNNLDTDSLLSNKDCFLTFTPNLLTKEVPKVFDKDKLVIQIEDSILINKEAHGVMQQYKANGYRIAILGFDFNARFLNVMPEVDIIKVDFSDVQSQSIDKLCSLARRFNKKIAAYGVNSPESRDLAIYYNCDFLQGDDVAEMLITNVNNIEHLRTTFFRLIACLFSETPNFEEISNIISLDVTLTFSVLRLVNSAYFSMKNKVTDVKQALTILGMKQLKKWIYLLSFSDDGGAGDELIKTSFLRAVFCQEVSADIPEMTISEQESYMLGMFSTLDALLEVSIESAIEKLPLSNHLKKGLINGEGKPGMLLSLCLAYEKGKWAESCYYIEKLNLSEELISTKYLKAVEYVDGIWSDLNKSSVK